MKFRPILHPFFLILYFILSLLASNLGVVRVTEAIRPLILSLIVTLFLVFFLRYREGEWAVAGLLCSTFLIVFFSYGHLYLITLAITYSLLIKVIPDLSGNILATLLHPFLIALWIVPFLLLRKAIRKYRDRSWEINKVLNLVAALFLIWPIFQILRHQSNLRQGTPVQIQVSSSDDLTQQIRSLDSPPDIYYIILDGYARQDTLASVYDYDNDHFLCFLRGQGFLIADSSMSNYAQTVLSIASSLNMDYLDSFSMKLDPDSRDVNWLIPIIRQNRVRNFLEANGYQIVTFESGYDRTEIPDADSYLQAQNQTIGTFESLWMRTTALLILEDASSLLSLPFPFPGYQAHITRIEFIFDELPLVAELSGPKFVFAHILIPHPPFVFSATGETLPQRHKFGLRDGSDFQGTPDEYIHGYRQQINFVNKKLEQILPKILANSSIPPIIILQGDHGPAAYLDWRSPQLNRVVERMTILNALLLPGSDGELPTERLSPVNSFRMVFNQVFGTDYTLLNDISYFSATFRPFDFVVVSEEQLPRTEDLADSIRDCEPAYN